MVKQNKRTTIKEFDRDAEQAKFDKIKRSKKDKFNMKKCREICKRLRRNEEEIL